MRRGVVRVPCFPVWVRVVLCVWAGPWVPLVPLVRPGASGPLCIGAFAYLARFAGCSSCTLLSERPRKFFVQRGPHIKPYCLGLLLRSFALQGMTPSGEFLPASAHSGWLGIPGRCRPLGGILSVIPFRGMLIGILGPLSGPLISS